MTHKFNLVNNVLTIHINGRGNAQEILHDLGICLDKETKPLTVILDLTLASTFDHNQKAMFYRALQHRNVKQVGIVNSNPGFTSNVQELIAAIQCLYAVQTATAEMDVLAKFGLAEAPVRPRKMAGLLSYLKKPIAEPG